MPALILSWRGSCPPCPPGSCDHVVSNTRGTNLRDVLVHKKTRQVGGVGQKEQGQGGSCGKNCSVCKIIYRQEERICGIGRVTSCTYDRTTGCRSRNVIYSVLCEV